MDTVQLKDFFLLCTLINFGLISIISLLLYPCYHTISQLHHKITHVPLAQLPKLYFQYLAGYKLLIIVFNLVPYLALVYLID
ncbi:DUF6868 family protein [Thalassotalea aquiviva]|uniref:DUF6868 family protein n=1 Tax=Thalassotalea aquiviva TaxID=3242415 RepID=UPI00352B5265